MAKQDLRNVSELKQFLDQANLKPRKSFSQNFIIEKSLLDRVIKAADVSEEDHILEIGPGLGSLTRSLLEKGAHVCAVELDRGFAELLPSILHPWKEKFQLIQGDILKQEFNTQMKVVSNIPFQITSPILSFLAKHRKYFSVSVLIVQNDMAVRMQGICGSKANSAFAIFCHFYFTMKTLFKIPNSCFYPKPKVESAAILLTPVENLPLKAEDHDAFFRFVKDCFKHKRKMLRSSLKHLDIKTALNKCGHKETARPEDLSLENYLSMFGFLSTTSEQFYSQVNE